MTRTLTIVHIMAVHPVVRVHPETGAKALYVNEHFTRRLVEMNATESKVVQIT